MLEFIQSHAGVLSVLGIAVIDIVIDVFHPNEMVTNVFNWILPFLRRSAGQ